MKPCPYQPESVWWPERKTWLEYGTPVFYTLGGGSIQLTPARGVVCVLGHRHVLEVRSDE